MPSARITVRLARGALVAAGILAAAQPVLLGQIPSSRIVYSRGQTVAPAYEGWEQNPDGSFNLVFGYMNRNLDERLDIPIGPDNRIEPGGPDRGQPTHFLPRRNRFAFSVQVPADFGEQELVWTLARRAAGPSRRSPRCGPNTSSTASSSCATRGSSGSGATDATTGRRR